MGVVFVRDFCFVGSWSGRFLFYICFLGNVYLEESWADKLVRRYVVYLLWDWVGVV